MAEHVHDCVVVGAGPAGSAAALQMARDGLDVVMLERGTRPGEKNVMSGVLYANKLCELIPDYRERAPLQRCITGGYAMSILGEEEVLLLPRLIDYGVADRPNAPYTVFRSLFDAWFAQEAENVGAELFTETTVDDLLWEDGRVAGVRTRRGDLRARVVIGADGVNSTVADKSGLRNLMAPSEVMLIIREILDLSAEIIEERFTLRPGEGMLSLFVAPVTGPTGKQGIYHTELYTNLDSLSLTTGARLDVIQEVGVPPYDVIAARERHPYITRLIQGATLREYQAHLLPWGGVADLGCVYGDGVLLAGDAGRFNTPDGVGSWPAMASGTAAARAVKLACESGDSSRATLAIYHDLLDEEGLVDVNNEAQEESRHEKRFADQTLQQPGHLLHLAERYLDDWSSKEEEYPYSLLGDAYHRLVKPQVPWYIRWPLNLAVWADTLGWRRKRASLCRKEARQETSVSSLVRPRKE
ncbi:FAD-dependent monooxygenase [Chloroflexota bacterium]